MLVIEELRKRYGGTVALDGLSMTVDVGQMVGFVGPNGAGKTTTMRIVLGVLSPDSGGVQWQGRPVDASVRRTFGYMPEERGLYPKMRVADQLVYLARLRGVAAGAASAAADRLLDALGLSERRRDAVESLSLGNQQRVQLAAALVHDPPLLVLDEPFSGLDPVGVDVLAGVLQERVDRGAAVVFSSHQLELVERLCERVAIVSRGRVVAAGRVPELRQGAYRRFRLQVDGAPGWAAGIPSAQPQRDGSVLLDLTEGVDEQAVLDTARRAGRVTHWSAVQPSLTDVFREVVSAEQVSA